MNATEVNEIRDRMRVDLKKLAFAREGDLVHGGLLKDISASGLPLGFVYPTGEGENPFKPDDQVEVDVDKIGSLKGKVIRSLETSIAIKLDITTEGEKELIAQIMAAANNVAIEEDKED
ncbi:MAG: PilZ domain-containing protein [Rhodospirillales bacterium]|jgi:hypothetical protein|nr:PilZ domain-containing protein [Rhodospirillales bacterium]